ncbi:heme ABC transporter ATP-binding protein [Thalassospira sp.]|uniref:heme ABC transporter ATP-binding protein n=1 Tax=Thalassospira sp. TaxID=1912094 RepID=UPI000C6B0541|nr:heme ABC transporter ATP-binding protein [Thalassospira sp.]MBC05048.1 heme ABC transporter ATP-binding protein [Thalassospira sp.]|tara:strand:- start:113 stop:946 length:834 start_codon:yes stop_codon:yes gene_type:complete
MTLMAHKADFKARGRYLLRDVSIAVEPGEVLAILGPNGAGKSTLLKVLAGELSPSGGKVFQNGRALSSISALELAQERAVMPQAASMTFPFTVFDVVALGRAPYRKVSTRQFDQKQVRRAIELADITHLADRAYPALSGGEKQRVHLARALVQLWGMTDTSQRSAASNGDDEQPSVVRFLLLDEPTAGLDVSHQHAVLALARQEAKERGVGVLMILHDFNQVLTYADRVAILSSGEVVEQGSVSDVMTPDLLSSVFKSPIRAIKDPAGGIVLVSQSA